MMISELHWSLQSGFPILASLQFFPLLVAIGILILGDSKKLFVLSILAGLIELGLAIGVYLQYDSQNSALQLAEQVTLLMPFQYHVAVDGVSVLFILLTALLSLMVMLYIYVIPLENRKKFLALAFVVEAALMSQFVSLDMLWFVLVSAIHLFITGYILWHWATSPERDLALSRYMQFMGMGIFLLLVGVLMLGWYHSDVTGHWSFDLLQLSQVPVDYYVQSLIFFLLFYGLAIRIPLFPLHGWLPVTAEHGMVAVAPVFLLGVKTGIYALIRFVLPLLPEAVLRWHEFIVAFAVIGIFYAALLALMQVNLRRLLAFAVVSHTSILIIGLFSLNHEAFMGGVMLAVNFGLAITGLLFTIGFIYWRTKTLLLDKLGGLFDQLPLFGIIFFVAGLSIIGMPGTPGFDSVHLVLEASIHRFGAIFTVAAAVGNVIAAGFLLWAFQRAFLAPSQAPSITKKEISTATTQEKVLALMMMVILLSIGFYSEPWLDLIEHSLLSLDNIYSQLDH